MARRARSKQMSKWQSCYLQRPGSFRSFSLTLALKLCISKQPPAKSVINKHEVPTVSFHSVLVTWKKDRLCLSSLVWSSPECSPWWKGTYIHSSIHFPKAPFSSTTSLLYCLAALLFGASAIKLGIGIKEFKFFCCCKHGSNQFILTRFCNFYPRPVFQTY